MQKAADFALQHTLLLRVQHTRHASGTSSSVRHTAASALAPVISERVDNPDAAIAREGTLHPHMSRISKLGLCVGAGIGVYLAFRASRCPHPLPDDGRCETEGVVRQEDADTEGSVSTTDSVGESLDLSAVKSSEDATATAAHDLLGGLTTRTGSSSSSYEEGGNTEGDTKREFVPAADESYEIAAASIQQPPLADDGVLVDGWPSVPPLMDAVTLSHRRRGHRRRGELLRLEETLSDFFEECVAYETARLPLLRRVRGLVQRVRQLPMGSREVAKWQAETHMMLSHAESVLPTKVHADRTRRALFMARAEVDYASAPEVLHAACGSWLLAEIEASSALAYGQVAVHGFALRRVPHAVDLFEAALEEAELDATDPWHEAGDGHAGVLTSSEAADCVALDGHGTKDADMLSAAAMEFAAYGKLELQRLLPCPKPRDNDRDAPGLKNAVNAAAHSIASYGQMDGDSHVVEPQDPPEATPEATLEAAPEPPEAPDPVPPPPEALEAGLGPEVASDELQTDPNATCPKRRRRQCGGAGSEIGDPNFAPNGSKLRFYRNPDDAAEVDLASVEAMLQERARLRQRRMWHKADQMRHRLMDEHHVHVEDHTNGWGEWRVWEDGWANPLYKTAMCNKITTLGWCPYGHKCQFAHSWEERQFAHDYASAARTCGFTLGTCQPAAGF